MQRLSIRLVALSCLMAILMAQGGCQAQAPTSLSTGTDSRKR